jgi:hypothetical protein
MRDVDRVIELLRRVHPGVSVRRLEVTHPGKDDDGLWFFEQPDSEFEVQIESSNGMCPFLIETEENDARLTTVSINETVETLWRLLHLRSE